MLSHTLPTNKLLNKMKGRTRQPFFSLLGMKTQESWNHRIFSVTNAANDRHKKAIYISHFPVNCFYPPMSHNLPNLCVIVPFSTSRNYLTYSILSLRVLL